MKNRYWNRLKEQLKNWRLCYNQSIDNPVGLRLFKRILAEQGLLIYN